MALTDINKTALVNIQLRADQMWASTQADKETIARTGFASAILNEQTAVITPLQSSSKDNVMEVHWITDCLVGEIACGDDCSPAGTEATADSATYTIDDCFSVTGFSVSEKQFRTSTLEMEEVVARQLNGRIASMDEALSKKVLADVTLQVGSNAYTSQYTAAAAIGNFTTIPAASVGLGLSSYFNRVKIHNNVGDHYFVDGGFIFDHIYNAGFDGLTTGNEDLAARVRGFGRVYDDIFNIPTINSKEQLFMFEKDAVAVATKNYWSPTPEEVSADRKRFSVPSRAYAGVNYDVIVKQECVGGEEVLTWDIKGYYKTLFNPLSQCNATQTGIYGFECV